MRFILTFESYLKGGRQPLYHFTYGKIDRIIESDTLKTSEILIIDRQGNRGHSSPNKIKSVCLTRYPSLYSHGNIRLMLDTDKLRKDGYIPYPFDELGKASTMRKTKAGNNGRKAFGYKVIQVQNNVDIKRERDTQWEIEYEERIDGDIENIGKYIIRIDFTDNAWKKWEKRLDLISDYIKKYPQIEIGLVDTKKVKLGSDPVHVMKTNPQEIVLNIEKIREMEKEGELVSQ